MSLVNPSGPAVVDSVGNQAEDFAQACALGMGKGVPPWLNDPVGMSLSCCS